MTRALSIDDLPYVNGGVLGMWLIQLRDAINSHHAGVAWEGGKSMQPVTGVVLKRFVAASNNVIGALRVEGEYCELGDCATLKDEVPPLFETENEKAEAERAATAAAEQKARDEEADALAEKAAEQAAHDAQVLALVTNGVAELDPDKPGDIEPGEIKNEAAYAAAIASGRIQEIRPESPDAKSQKAKKK